jgi:hypothetical protein
MGFGDGTTHSGHTRLGVTAALLAVFLAGVFVLVDRGAGAAEAAAIDPEVRDTVGVFRTARTVADRLPGDPSAALRAADDIRPGENPDLGSGCIPIRVIRDRGVDIGVQTRLNLREKTYDDVRVFGIARDGVANVRLSLRNGVEHTAIVRNNTFLALDLPDRPVAVSWTDQTGVHSLDVPGQTAAELAEEIAGP